ncbi:N-formylglutamate amidohydrolase [Bradyrhizobium erythrophlei]|uniref:N-formylglutamate amidohydrolase n=1 Tax=Bradyrhizobium erythrophlei TaxID=1437360 RepID=UPI0035F09C6E
MTDVLAGGASRCSQQLYRIEQPVPGKTVPVVASMPHSGTFVPPSIARAFTPLHRAWLRSTDWYLPQVYDFLPELGVTTIAATHSRYVTDLNRDPEGLLFGSFRKSVFSDSMFDGTPIYREAPDAQSLLRRLVKYHSPYHEELSNILGRALTSCDRVLLLDLHSFFGPIDDDICIGDLRGASCHQETTTIAVNAFERRGFRVVCNEPFSGGYLIRKHHNASTEALQIELHYATYLDCRRIDEPVRPQIDTKRLQHLKPRLRNAFKEIIDLWCAK